MTDRPFAAGADTAAGPTPGYYPDPSIPGFVRYWGGTGWVPGTSRRAPAEGEHLPPPVFAARQAPPVVPPRHMPPPAAVPPPAAPGGAGGGPDADAGSGSGGRGGTGGETGPVFLDQTGAGAAFTMAPHAELELRPRAVVEPRRPAPGPLPEFTPEPRLEPLPPLAVQSSNGPDGSGWRADPTAQRGLLETGAAPRWVSWGVLGSAEADAAIEGDAEGGPQAGGAAGSAVESGAESVAVSGAITAPEPAVTAAPEPGAVETAAVEPAAVAPAGAHAAPTPAPTARPAAPTPAAPTPAAPTPAAPTPAAPAPVAPTPAAARPTVPKPTVPKPTVPMPAAVRSAPFQPAAAKPGAAAKSAARRPVQPRAAGLGRRLLARTVDTAVVAVVAAAAAVPLAASTLDHLREKLDQAQARSQLTGRSVQVWLVDPLVVGKAAALLGVLVLLGVVYEVLPTARTGQTFGKRLARIKVVDAGPAAGRARPQPPRPARSLLRWVSGQFAAVLVVGLVWPLLDRRERRGLQDRAARTRVVRA